MSVVRGFTNSSGYGKKRRSRWVYKIIFLSMISLVLGQEDTRTHARLFPEDDEYDPLILDPNTLYGSPYGGFSRAVQSRLASRPLKLPDLAADNDKDYDEASSFHEEHGESFWEISDAFGRRYACSLFYEDDVESLSLNDSMFEPPKLDTKAEADDHKIVDEKTEEEFKVLEVERRLNLMEGVCVLRRGKYWTYEWCWEGQVQQFDLDYKKKGNMEPSVEIESVSSFGRFQNREVNVQHYKLPVNHFGGETAPMAELARVKEIYTDGGDCTGPEGSKRTVAHFHCCPPRIAAHHSDKIGSVLFFGKTSTIAFAKILDIWEDPDNDCHHVVDICTPLLCEAINPQNYVKAMLEREYDINPDFYLNKATHSSNIPPKLENMSVRRILEETLGDSCLVSAKESWWSYQYCHRRYIRQFHQRGVTGINSRPRTARKEDPSDDTQYFLGVYNGALDSYLDADEWEHVVSTTSGIDKQRRGGNGAYFEQEYPNGEMCVLEDAGDDDDGSKASVERSASVRYSCGADYAVTVQEDRTCHYVVEVTVPRLCEHPLFTHPVVRKRVFKCLPVEEHA